MNVYTTKALQGVGTGTLTFAWMSPKIIALLHFEHLLIDLRAADIVCQNVSGVGRPFTERKKVELVCPTSRFRRGDRAAVASWMVEF